jgi:nondiscriminating glutamyl-tRNA synthetase
MPASNQKIRTRFAPSPTGFVHIGSLRTALFSFLFARHHGGTHILRIEDTDQNRSVLGAVENLLWVMKKMGVEFDEGYYVNDAGDVAERGEYGPYLQSKRLDLYKKYAQELVASGKAYYCFCQEARLDELRKEQIALKKPPMYDRHCRNFSVEEVAAKKKEFVETGKTPVIRQAIPLEGQTVIHDLIYGDVTYDHQVLDDQVLLKSDGFPTYHLAVVIDDHLMEISHVIRGEEWIPSTPKHILLYEAFGWQPTAFAHLPLILNPDKSKLSKRQGDVSVEDFLNKGYLKDALLNFVAFLGWNPKTEQEMFTLDELIKQFELAKVNNSGAVLDSNKLDWINGLYIRKLEVGELVNLLIPFWKQIGYIDVQDDSIIIKQLNTQINKTYLEAITALEQERLKKLSEIGERTAYFFTDILYDPELLVWKKSDAADAKVKLELLAGIFGSLSDHVLYDKTKLEEALKAFMAKHKFDNGSVLWPLRVALTGQQASPGPFEVASVLASGLGRQVVVDRLKKATKLL